MKRQNLIIVVAAALVTAIFSFILSGMIFGSPQKNRIKVPVVQKISSTFPSPKTDTDYQNFFNNKALNPTQLIQIGGGGNSKPFQGGQSQ